MGLIAAGRRLRYVWTWRIRFWWFDTEDGRRAQAAVGVLAAVMACVHLALLVIDVKRYADDPSPHAQHALWPVWVIYLIIAVASAALSYALSPKPKAPQPVSGDAPVVEDGLSVKHHFGTVWEEELFVLAWKIVDKTAIKSKGGK